LCILQKVRKDLTYAQKLKIIEMLEHGAKQKEVCNSLGCSQAQVSATYKNRDQIRQRVCQNPSRIRVRAGKAADVEWALADWYESVCMPGKYIPNEILVERAQEFAKKMGNTSFRPTLGWLNRWKNRFNVPMQSKVRFLI
jgi:hypothetical protein